MYHLTLSRRITNRFRQQIFSKRKPEQTDYQLRNFTMHLETKARYDYQDYLFLPELFEQRNVLKKFESNS